MSITSAQPNKYLMGFLSTQKLMHFVITVTDTKAKV